MIDAAAGGAATTAQAESGDMIQRSIKRISLRALVVDDELTSPTAEDGMSVIVSDSAIHTILMEMVDEYVRSRR